MTDRSPWPSKHAFAHRLVVRYADTDAQGHVYFANYLTFFDEGLTGYFHAVGLPPKVMVAEEGVDLVYAKTEVSYRGASYVEDPLDIHCRIVRFGRTSFTTDAAIYRGDGFGPLALATLVNVCVDAKTLRPTTVPPRLREAVRTYEGDVSDGAAEADPSS